MDWFDPDSFHQWVQARGAAGPLFFLLVVGQPVVPLPITVYSAVAGLAFGALPGAALSWCATQLRSSGAYFLSGYLGRRRVQSWLQQRAAWLGQQVAQNPLRSVFWVRLVPNLPFDVQSYALGLSGVRFSAFLLGTALGTIPWVAGFAVFGYSLTAVKGLKLIGWLLIAGVALILLKLKMRSLRKPSGEGFDELR